MHAPIADLAHLLQQLQPSLNAGRFAFVSVHHVTALGAFEPLALMREAEGVSAILTEVDAQALHLPIRFLAAWITLGVHSDLAAVGLTAAVATALAQAGIGCNVVAGAHHDHLFVPVAEGERALQILASLQGSVPLA